MVRDPPAAEAKKPCEARQRAAETTRPSYQQLTDTGKRMGGTVRGVHRPARGQDATHADATHTVHAGRGQREHPSEGHAEACKQRQPAHGDHGNDYGHGDAGQSRRPPASGSGEGRNVGFQGDWGAWYLDPDQAADARFRRRYGWDGDGDDDDESYGRGEQPAWQNAKGHDNARVRKEARRSNGRGQRAKRATVPGETETGAATPMTNGPWLAQLQETASTREGRWSVAGPSHVETATPATPTTNGRAPRGGTGSDGSRKQTQAPASTRGAPPQPRLHDPTATEQAEQGEPEGKPPCPVMTVEVEGGGEPAFVCMERFARIEDGAWVGTLADFHAHLKTKDSWARAVPDALTDCCLVFRPPAAGSEGRSEGLAPEDHELPIEMADADTPFSHAINLGSPREELYMRVTRKPRRDRTAPNVPAAIAPSTSIDRPASSGESSASATHGHKRPGPRETQRGEPTAKRLRRAAHDEPSQQHALPVRAGDARPVSQPASQPTANAAVATSPVPASNPNTATDVASPGPSPT